MLLRSFVFPLLVSTGLALLTIFVAMRWSLSKALLWVYLPILLWIPLYMHFGFGGVYVDAGSLAATSLALIALVKGRGTWRFSFTDVLVGLYAFSSFWADAHHRPFSLGLYAMTATLFASTFPYIIGKTVIEQTRSREQVAKLLVLSLAIVAIISLWEFRMTSNLFQVAIEATTHVKSGWGRQRRWGFARVAGPYGHAITAGMVFTIGLLLEIWLVFTKRWRVSQSKFSRSQSKLRRNAQVITLLVLLGLFETQSRGPWIGCGLGLIVAAVGLTRNRKRSAIIAGILLTISLSTAYVVLDRYTNAEAQLEEKSATEDQQNAVYRRQLITTYQPLIAQGGIWGWGSPVPDVTGFGAGAYALHQPSIDNEYLRISMAQGYFGGVLFAMMVVTTIIVLIKHCIAFRRRVDITFAYVMLGIVVATGFSLSTVYLGLPMMQILFMFFGWSQVLKPTDSESAPEQLKATPQYAFERVYS